MNTNEATIKYCQRIADDALILGHRLSEWCSKAPFIEEDLALTNIALDYIGRAESFLKYAGELENKGQTADHLAYRRAENKYLNHLICEQVNGDFANTIARQLLFSAYDYLLQNELTKSKDATIAGIASKAVKEAKYHLQHAIDWTIRLGDGTKESKERIQNAINNLWMYTGELFEMDEVENALLKAGIAVDLIPIKSQWEIKIQAVLDEATLTHPEESYMQTGGRTGIHTENLGHILSEMQYLQRTYPDAEW
ncbi:MAG: 1,2-phenylacetyl-CoA epoxidase subunit PaaC [Bacteroidia bacterium]